MIRLLVMKMLENIKHKKLFLFVISLLVVVGGYFVYKYSYIYLERKKYSQAEVAIKKVAADLEAQGIKTEFSKGCQNTQTVIGKGTTYCSTYVVYNGNQTTNDVKDVVKNLVSLLSKYGFTLDTKYHESYSIEPAPDGTAVYTYPDNSLQCRLTLSNSWSENSLYTIQFGCSDGTKFSLF